MNQLNNRIHGEMDQTDSGSTCSSDAYAPAIERILTPEDDANSASTASPLKEAVPAAGRMISAVSSVSPTNNTHGTSQYNMEGSVVKLRSSIRCTDHFTLKAPSSTVRFRDTDFKVYGQRASQMLLEDKGDGELMASSAKDGSFGVSAVRFWYCLVAVLMTGFLFIFCLQCLLLLFLSMCIDSGLTSKSDFEFGQFFGSLLSLPLWIYGLASAMAIASSFITDTWNGSNFIRSITSWRSVHASWITFFVFLGVPLIVMITTLFVGSDEWWQITALVWFSFVFAFYCVFAVSAVVFEVRGSLELMRHNFIYKETKTKGVFPLLKCMILNRFINRYSGIVQRQYTLQDSEKLSNTTDLKSRKADHEKMGLATKFTLWLCDRPFGLYTTIDEPKRLYNIDEVRDAAPFVTSNTWTLDKLYFRDRSRLFIAVVSGPSAMTQAQVTSSFICAALGLMLAIITVTSLLVWLDASPIAIGLISMLLILCTLPNFQSIYESYGLFKDIKARHEKDVELGKPRESEAVYKIWEDFRVTQPSNNLCWVLFFLEIKFCFFYPLIALFMVGNSPIAFLFLFSGLITGARIYCNPVNIIAELGPLDQFLDEDNDSGPYGHWRDRARMNLILSKITQGRRRDLWIYCFGTIVILFCAIFLGKS